MPEESGKYKIPLLPFEVRPEVVGRYALGGALTGAGAAAALNLVHLLRDLNKKREAAQQPAQTGKDTIVLTIPKRGEVKDKSSGMITKSTKAPQESTIMREMVSRNNQVIQDNGRYGMKTMMKKKADWPTLTASLLAAGGAGTLGYKLIDKLYEARRMKQMQGDVDKAKKEYLDVLLNKSGEEKTAGDTFSYSDYPLGIAALALLLGSGSTAFITKKLLDEMGEGTPGKVKPKQPSLKKLVFRTEGEKVASDDTDGQEVLEATLGVFLDVCSGQPTILGDEKVAEAMEKSGTSAPELYKMAAGESYNQLIATLEGNPDLRKTIQRASMETHPLLKYFKWAVGIPGISGFADKKMYGKLDETFNPAPKTAGVLGALTPDPRSIVSSFYGSSLAEKAQQPEVAPEEPQEDTRAEELLEKLKIVADDPKALEFIQNNKERLAALIEQLAEEGTI